MSYCRWSSDGWSCDVYVYESESGYVTHVASRRHVAKEPCPTIDWNSILKIDDRPEMLAAIDRWRAAERDWLESSELEDIGLPHDGATFYDRTPADCARTLCDLLEMGYNVPRDVVDTLLEEAENGAS